jgi:hypothetical protein
VAAAVPALAAAVLVEQILWWIRNSFRKTFGKTASLDGVTWIREWTTHNTLPFFLFPSFYFLFPLIFISPFHLFFSLFFPFFFSPSLSTRPFVFLPPRSRKVARGSRRSDPSRLRPLRLALSNAAAMGPSLEGIKRKEGAELRAEQVKLHFCSFAYMKRL